MSPGSKELETPELQQLEEVATQEIDSYIERVEKKLEIDPTVANTVQTAPSQTPTPSTIKDDKGQVIMQPVDDAKKVVLPMTQDQLQEGLHHQIVDSVRWLSEWCVMLIKKYPGRVFYKTEEKTS